LAAALVEWSIVDHLVKVDEDPVQRSITPLLHRRALRKILSLLRGPVKDGVRLDLGDQVRVQAPCPVKQRRSIVAEDRASLDPVQLARAAEDGLDGELVVPGVEGGVLQSQPAVEAPGLRPAARGRRPGGECQGTTPQQHRSRF
jgi:hypothetical protein